jgi:hypothetical protein
MRHLVLALALAAATAGFSAPASAAPAVPALGTELTTTTLGAENIDWRPYRHCHGPRWNRWCHGGRRWHRRHHRHRGVRVYVY